MIKILFICHGNICRSPMAEFVMKNIVSTAGMADEFVIASAATSSEELGNPVYPPAARKLAEHGICCAGKTARRMRPEDYRNFDMLIGMDEENLRNMRHMFGGDPDRKLHLLLEFAGRPGQAVADPWYTRDFEATWRDVEAGCLGLFALLAEPVELDFSRCTEKQELFREMREKMDWQKWYGNNLDALWDVLTGLPHKGKHFIISLPDAESDIASYADSICDIFREAGVSFETVK